MTATDFAAWEREIATAGGCAHPVRLRGRTRMVDLATGEVATVYDTAGEPSGVVHVACGNRRESACPACSAVYKRDARHLVAAGLAGGKGVPASVAEHPCVFATFTAPSFGPVHSRREKNGQVRPCRPRRDRDRRACPHGRDLSCPLRHSPADPRIGQPVCPDCYDYQGTVTFNAAAPLLWRRFLTYLPRHLARNAAITVKDCRAQVRPRCIKVSEYQRRGVIHYHAVIRLDANTAEGFAPPGPRWTAVILAQAVKGAAAQATARYQVPGSDRPAIVRFGRQTDVKVIGTGTGHAVTARAVANYIAKYVTKAAGVPGLPGSRIRYPEEIAVLRCPPHHRRLIATAWQLGMGRWAHQSGYGGHPITKSRRYSLTFGRLHQARIDHRKAARQPDGETDPWGRPLDEHVVLILKDWHYAGSGYAASDAYTAALMSADNARKR